MIDASNINRQVKQRTIPAVDERFNTTVQEYVEIIRDLLGQNQVARVKEIANERGVTRSSVSSALNNLRELGLIDHEHYGYVVLTEEGENLGAILAQRHYIIRRFLQDILGLPEKLADEESCRLEHTMSPEALNALIKFVNAVEDCSHRRENAQSNASREFKNGRKASWRENCRINAVQKAK